LSRYTLEEEEQIASLKAFWGKYGNFILTVLILIFGGFAANNGYKWWQAHTAKEAVAGYESLQEAVNKGDLELLKKVQSSLLEDHKRTPYAERGAIVAARAFYDAKNVEEAKKSLAWVVENGKSEEFVATARLTLSGLLLEEGKTDEAKALVQGVKTIGFEGLFHDRLGDIAMISKDYAGAKVAYDQALLTLQPNSPWQEVVKRKLSAVPGVQPTDK
jgi:predicted negative regulator of RcsB-dependent stress response